MAKRLFQPVDIASLAFFRIVFGILGFADVLNTYIYYHLTLDLYNPEKFRFYYYGFEWARPLPEPFMSIAFLSICGLAILIALGKWYRWSSLLFAFGFTYIFLLEKSNYLNHGYLFCWISFLMPFLPLNRQYAADVLDRPSLRSDTVPYWCLFLIQFLMGVVYFYGGLAKINADWLNAIPLKHWLGAQKSKFLIGPVLGQEWAAYFMAYGGLLLDLTVVFFLMGRKTRPWAFAAVLFFHFINHLVFNIGIFPFLSVALTALFFPPHFPRTIFHWLQRRFFVFERIANWWQRRMVAAHSDGAPLWQSATANRVPILGGLLMLMLFHLLVPFRHHIFPGDVAWTEEGHRYSWRMMLRAKDGYGTFIVRDKNTQKEEVIRPAKWMYKKQRRKLYGHPDMILQFAHHLKRHYAAEGKEVEIYADIRTRLNYREYHIFINPSVDLALVEWQFFKPSGWIMPEGR